MIVGYSEDSVDGGMIDLSQANVDAEDKVNEVVEQDV